MYRYDTDSPAPTIENMTTYYTECIRSIRDAMAGPSTFTAEQLAEQLIEAETGLAALIEEQGK